MLKRYTALLTTICLLSLFVSCGPTSGPNTNASRSGGGGSGDYNFVIRMYGDFPSKFKDKNIHILVEGRRVDTRQSSEPLKELRFSLSKSQVDQATAGKEGPEASRLDVTVRLEPKKWEGKEETLAVMFDIRETKPEYDASWGTGRIFEGDPVAPEDTHQKTRIN
ncbi:hypothetical protein [Acanthopleuribacter pedis]|uniref:Lipoprotein n=1 Tax=Acanthopleuribacter pedis TaxID=442870 RepID=A0A8J7U0J3_9BACT|nr:hypothetical protein [Acanthopleuribacter pedis]MBO1317133.1 hypothetical protein [Acanthopleuribacter pedis]